MVSITVINCIDRKVLVYNPEERYSPSQGLMHPFIVQLDAEQQQQPPGDAASERQSSAAPAMDVVGGENADSHIESNVRKAARKEEFGARVAAGEGSDNGSTSGQGDEASVGEDSLLSSDARGRNAAGQHRVR
jgi:serine/threonine protein kinase